MDYVSTGKLNSFTKEITKLRAAQHDVILLGDANEDVYQGSRIREFLVDNNMYNVIERKHEGRGPATYDRGTKCIDLVSSLIELWEIVPYCPIPTKVKGHADALQRSLSPLEKLNCIVDDYAKEIATYY